MAPAFTVRLLGAGDSGVLVRVDDDVFDEPVQPALAAAYLAHPDNLLAVALEDGIVVGMASAIAYLHPDKPLQLFVNEVGVASRAQRRGIGRALLDAIVERGRAMGCKEAWVATEVSNTAARALYVAAGGAEDPDHAVVYTWKLDDQERATRPARAPTCRNA